MRQSIYLQLDALAHRITIYIFLAIKHTPQFCSRRRAGHLFLVEFFTRFHCKSWYNTYCAYFVLILTSDSFEVYTTTGTLVLLLSGRSRPACIAELASITHLVQVVPALPITQALILILHRSLHSHSNIGPSRTAISTSHLADLWNTSYAHREHDARFCTKRACYIRCWDWFIRRFLPWYRRSTLVASSKSQRSYTRI